MSRMIDLREKVVELKKRRMEILFTPLSQREASFVNELRQIKVGLAKLIKEIKSA